MIGRKHGTVARVPLEEFRCHRFLVWPGIREHDIQIVWVQPQLVVRVIAIGGEPGVNPGGVDPAFRSTRDETPLDELGRQLEVRSQLPGFVDQFVLDLDSARIEVEHRGQACDDAKPAPPLAELPTTGERAGREIAKQPICEGIIGRDKPRNPGVFLEFFDSSICLRDEPYHVRRYWFVNGLQVEIEQRHWCSPGDTDAVKSGPCDVVRGSIVPGRAILRIIRIVALPALQSVGHRVPESRDAQDLPIEQRQTIFRTLVEIQDTGMGVLAARTEISKRFSVTDAQIKDIEREGLDQQWPPL